MSDIRNLEPKELWNYFHEITQIPHPSKNEKKIAEYIVKFGNTHGLETIVDRVGNVIIRKPATKGMETRNLARKAHPVEKKTRPQKRLATAQRISHWQRAAPYGG